MFKNMKVLTKLIIGFDLVLILTIIVSAIGIIYLGNAKSGFADYRSLARQVKELSAVEIDLGMLRMNAVKYNPILAVKTYFYNRLFNPVLATHDKAPAFFPAFLPG